MSVAVSGATTLAASDDWLVATLNVSDVTGARTIVLSGLTAGTNTFTLQYRVGATTGSFFRRYLTVQGIA
jgi:hypothetical protein